MKKEKKEEKPSTSGLKRRATEDDEYIETKKFHIFSDFDEEDDGDIFDDYSSEEEGNISFAADS